jgi:hypothetical protein
MSPGGAVICHAAAGRWRRGNTRDESAKPPIGFCVSRLDGPVLRAAAYHLPDVIPLFLPFQDDVAGLIAREDVNGRALQEREDLVSVRPIGLVVVA